MKKENLSVESCQDQCFSRGKHDHCGGSNAIYGLGVIGALFYFLQGAASFTAVIMGIGKAIFWPALLMFKLLTYLQM
jgi:hypothetical protein